jgi:hypothetical protein
MKKILFILTLAAISLTSCLKDTPNTNFSGIGTVIELPYAGLQYFSSDAVTAPGDTIVESFGINIASAKTLSTATNYTLVVNNALLTAYNTANPAITYLPMPQGSYKISKLSGTIAAGKRLDSVTVTFYKNQLDPSKSYMLPIALASASNGILSGNFNAHYYHFIGNDFAGTYEHYYTRWSIPDSSGGKPTSQYYHEDIGSTTLSPVSPSEFTMNTNYYTQPDYDVTFTKTGAGSTATYSNFQVTWYSGTPISQYFTPGGVTVTDGPSFDSNIVPAYNPNTQYTYAQAVKLFRIYFKTGSRVIVDEYYKTN